MRRLALLIVAGLALAGCGSSSNSSTTNASAAAQADIKSAYQTFFSPSTSLADRVAVLQKGSDFKSVVQGFASNPLAKKVGVTVTSVKLEGANNAKVVYTIKLGSAGLPKQTGTAVRESGRWKVGYASLCKLVALNGGAPPACAP
jgi:hypothetical protein